METDDRSFEALRRAYEELARRVVQGRLAFADRVQEVVDDAQRELADRDRQIRELAEEVERLRARVDSLHAELKEAHESNAALERSRSMRYTAPLRSFVDAFRRR